jgi:hypothetical protein
MSNKDNSIIFTVRDPMGVTVTFYTEQWSHIQNRHPEIRTVGKIRSGAQNPDLILLDEERNTRIYSTISPTSLCFNVFTRIVSETECIIKTSYISPLPEGDCIWRR